MDLIERISSLMTLLSLFIVAPALGRALLLWWDERTQRSLPSQHVALTVSTMIVLTALIAVYWGGLEGKSKIDCMVCLDQCGNTYRRQC
jgi:hypothetical protein